MKKNPKNYKVDFHKKADVEATPLDADLLRPWLCNEKNMKNENPKTKLDPWLTLPFRLLAAILIILLITIILGFTLQAMFSANQIAISIEYNIGEIVGAILAGLGIAAAGLGYARSKIVGNPSPGSGDAEQRSENG